MTSQWITLSPAGLAKLDRMVGDGIEVVYQQGSVTIYQVMRP